MSIDSEEAKQFYNEMLELFSSDPLFDNLRSVSEIDPVREFIHMLYEEWKKS